MTNGISVLIGDEDAFYSTWEREQRNFHDVTGFEGHSAWNNGVHIFDRLHRLLSLKTISGTRSGRVKLPTQIQIINIVRDSDQHVDRDKVYGIFNLIAPQISAHIQPNYNLSVEQVYIDFTKAVIQATNSLDIICQARTVRPQSLTFRERYREEYLQVFREKLLNEFGEELFEKWGEELSEIKNKVFEYCGKIAQYQPLPSWVLDLREKTSKKIELTSVLRPYNTCNPSVATIEFIDKILCTKGFKIDEVDGLGPTCSHEPSCKNNCIIQPVHKNSPYGSEASKMNALWHTLAAGRDVSLEAITAAYERILQIPWIDWESVAESDRHELFGTNLHGFHKYRLSSASLLLGGRTLKSYFPPKNEQKIREQMEDPELKKQIRRVQGVWHRRKLMVTAKGHFGMATELAQQGDHICILFGCSTPVILRPNLYDSTYTMIGETYVHGFMEREGMKGLERGRYEAKTFAIV